MNYLLLATLILISFTQRSYSQEKIDWSKIKKIELYLVDSQKDNKITSKDLNSKTLIKCESEKIVNYFKEVDNCTFDALVEKNNYALKIYFSTTQKDFLLLLNQGVMFEMNKWTCYSIIKKDELKKFIENIMKENGL